MKYGESRLLFALSVSLLAGGADLQYLRATAVRWLCPTHELRQDMDCREL